MEEIWNQGGHLVMSLYSFSYKIILSLRKTNTVWFHLYVESKEQNKWTNIQRNRVTNTETGAKVEVGRVRREKGEGEQVV